MKSGIYIIRNLVSNKIYIGSAVNLDRRLKYHVWALKKGVHPNIHLQRAWKKYDDPAFEFKVYFTCEKKDLIFHEQLSIDASITRYGKENVYNICPTAGSTLGRRFSEETKRKIGLQSRGRWTGKHHTEETKLKIKLGNMGRNKGRVASKEARRKMSEAKRGIKFSEEHKKKLSLASMGRKKSLETLEKIRMSMLGKKHSKETKKKIGDAFRGKPGTRLGIKNKRHD